MNRTSFRAQVSEETLQAAQELDKLFPKIKAHECRAPKASAANELMLYGVIGDSWDMLDAKSVIDRVKAMNNPEEIVVRINSGGGYLYDGLAIYNYLASLKSKVTVLIDGLAASMASAIAVVGDRIVMPENAMMMIHDPWNVAVGNAAEMRKNADFLDRCKVSMLALYGDATGQKREDIARMMSDETWMNGVEAVGKGFATETVAAVEAAALVRASINHLEIKNLPGALQRESRQLAAVKPPAQETTMTDEEKAAAAAADRKVKEIQAAADAAVVAERQRVTDIDAAVSAAKLPADFAKELVNNKLSIDEARAKIIDRMAAEAAKEPDTQGQISILVDGRDKFRAGVQASILARAGLTKDDGANNYRGYVLVELARMSLETAGIKTHGLDRMKMVKMALTHGTSDFANILENIANKAMMKGYDEGNETFQLWTMAGTLTDFKSASRVDLSAFSSLTAVPEHGEYSYGTMGDRKEAIILATYGKLFTISRQAIINDDLSAFTRIPQRMGRAAIRTIGDLVYAILTGNPNMADGNALFDTTNHKNLASSGTAITMASVDAMRVAMATQKDRKNAAVTLNLRPKFLLTPVAKGGTARALMASETDPSQSNAKKPNIVQGLCTVIDDARLDVASTTAWYGAADPTVTDTVEVAYLDGVQVPTLEQHDPWKNDGVEFKIRIDSGVKALAWESIYKDPGA